MSNGFLNNQFRDWIAVIGVLGTLATLVALAITIVQIRRTRRVSEETQRAANETLETVRRQLTRYTAGILLRHLNEAQDAFSRQDWKLVVVRLGDLAEQAAQVLAQSDKSETDWGRVAFDLRTWQNSVRAFETGRTQCPQSQLTKWNRFTQDLATQLDRLNLPI
jgi:hypothetical protein